MSHFKDMGLEIKTQDDIIETYKRIQKMNKKIVNIQNEKEYYIVSKMNNFEFWFYYQKKKLINVEFTNEKNNYFEVTFDKDKQEKLKKHQGFNYLYYEEKSLGIPLKILTVNSELLFYNKDFQNKNNKDNCKIEVSIFAEEFHSKDKSEDNIKLAEETFIPLGSFNKKDISRCLVGGFIEEINIMKNPFTAQEYYEIVLKCLTMKFNIAISKELIKEKIKIGDRIIISGWMSAKILLDN